MGKWEFVLWAALIQTASGQVHGEHFVIERGGDFQSTIDLAASGDTITIAAGKTVAARSIVD